MDHDTWCTCCHAVLGMASAFLGNPDHEPTACEYHMHRRALAFWIPLANAFRPPSDAFPRLRSTPRWVAWYEWNCMRRWLELARAHYGPEAPNLHAWIRGIEACKILMEAYGEWTDGFDPPSDWESSFAPLVADVFEKSAGTFPGRPTMEKVWFDEIVRFWVPYRFGPRSADLGDPHTRLRVWKQKLSAIQRWIQVQVSRFTKPDWSNITRAQTTHRVWERAYDTAQTWVSPGSA